MEESQWSLRMLDVIVDCASVDTEVSGGIRYGVELFRYNLNCVFSAIHKYGLCQAMRSRAWQKNHGRHEREADSDRRKKGVRDCAETKRAERGLSSARMGDREFVIALAGESPGQGKYKGSVSHTSLTSGSTWISGLLNPRSAQALIIFIKPDPILSPNPIIRSIFWIVLLRAWV